VNRRTLLRNLGLGLSAGLIAPPFLSSCKKDDPGPEVPFDGTVAIIGAGAAGMYAADILHAKGINVFILEASDQIGGRIRSLRNQTGYEELFGQDTPIDFSSDFPLELGAEIYQGSDSIWGKAVQNQNIPTEELSSAGVDRYIIENLVKTASDWGGDADFAAVENFVANLSNYSGSEQSVQQAAAVSERVQSLLNAQAGNFYGSTSDKIGIKLLTEELHERAHDGKSVLLKANPMQDFFLSRFSLIQSLVQLNKVVTSINYSADEITIKDKDGNEYKANKVIVTVPLAVLKTGGISFSPSLPATNLSAMDKFGMDPSFRAVIEFKKNFWGEDAGYIWGGTVAPQCLNTGVGRSEFYRTLSFTINGSKAASLSSMSRDQQLSAILGDMDAVYAGLATKFVRRVITKDADGNDVEGPIVAAVKDWTKEENIQGGYSYPLINATSNDRANLGKSISKKIFFAGEATDTGGDAGTINGAMASAERVALEVINSITNVS
jgi:monoamine oxidase